MADSKTVEGEIADFGSQPAQKPDIQIAHAPVKIDGAIEKFDQGKLAAMYASFTNMDKYHAQKDETVMQIDAQLFLKDVKDFLRFEQLYLATRNGVGALLKDLDMMTKVFDDVKGLDDLVKQESNVVAPKILRKRILRLSNECIGKINNTYVPDLEVKDTQCLDMSDIYETMVEISQEDRLISTILLTKQLYLLLDKQDDAFSRFLYSGGITYNMPVESLFRNYQNLAAFCEGKKNVQFTYDNYNSDNKTNMYKKMLDLDPVNVQPAKSVQKGLWSIIGR